MTGEGETTVEDETSVECTPRPRAASGGDGKTVLGDDESSTFQQHTTRHQTVGQEESVLSDVDGDLSGSTPRPPATKSLSARPQFAGLDSPYEALMKRELSKAGGAPGLADETDSELLFQQQTERLPDMSMTPQGSRSRNDNDDSQFGSQNKNKDPLLHRMLDKNYRIMATPHKGGTGVSPIKWKVTEMPAQETGAKSKGKEKVPIWQDSPMSSPEMAVPQLRSAAFMSPMRAAYRGKTAAAAAARAAPRTPGISVQTPATGRKTKDVYGTAQKEGWEGRYADEITWESDSDDNFAGMSPPKTIQFALPPSKLLQTPGKLSLML
jgi:DASH complex subunit ASK1